MAQKYVVSTDPEGAQVLYLTGYNLSDPPASTFGNLQDAVEYDELETAQGCAASIGAGTVGTTKP